MHQESEYATLNVNRGQDAAWLWIPAPSLTGCEVSAVLTSRAVPSSARWGRSALPSHRLGITIKWNNKPIPMCFLLILLINKGYGEAECMTVEGEFGHTKMRKTGPPNLRFFELMSWWALAVQLRDPEIINEHVCTQVQSGNGDGRESIHFIRFSNGHRPNLRNPRSAHFLSPLCVV